MDEPATAAAFSLSSVDDLKASPWNPREIDDASLAALQTSLERFGDLSGIVVNAQTGNLVAGHQRVRALREKYGTELQLVHRGDDYALLTPEGEEFGIRIVDWELPFERAANIAANAHTLAGVFTPDVDDILAQISNELPDLYDLLRLHDVGAAGEEEEKKAALDDGPELPALELQPFEHYDLVVILADNTMDWEWLCEKFKVHKVNSSPIAGKKKIGISRAMRAKRFMQLWEQAHACPDCGKKRVERDGEVKWQ